VKSFDRGTANLLNRGIVELLNCRTAESLNPCLILNKIYTINQRTAPNLQESLNNQPRALQEADNKVKIMDIFIAMIHGNASSPEPLKPLKKEVLID
jgi:hypothetical protein